MKDENGNVLTEKEIIKEALNNLSEACCFLFECESPEGKALAFMTDSLLKYGQVIYRDDCPLSATCDYEEYENEVYQRKKNSLKVIK